MSIQSGSKIHIRCEIDSYAFDETALYYVHRADGVKRWEEAPIDKFRWFGDKCDSVECTFVEMTDHDASRRPGPDGYEGVKGFVVLLPGGERAEVFATDVVLY